VNARRRLFLVKHGRPHVVPELPARQWALSEEGLRQSGRLAQWFKAHLPTQVVSSLEPKARETGKVLASRLKLPFSPAPNLHEHQRENAPFFPDPALFEAKVQEFFAEPGRLVFGEETADQAHSRFAQAVNKVMNEYLIDDVALVAHGTVITLLVSRANGLSPFPLWKALGFCGVVEVEWPSLKMVQVVERI
jgi:broad specificity phosphatase PhoE